MPLLQSQTYTRWKFVHPEQKDSSILVQTAQPHGSPESKKVQCELTLNLCLNFLDQPLWHKLATVLPAENQYPCIQSESITDVLNYTQINPLGSFFKRSQFGGVLTASLLSGFASLDNLYTNIT